MIKHFSVVFAALLLTGCGADVAGACENYIAAANACNEDYATAAGVDPATLTVDDAFCDAYADLKDQESVDYLDCLGAAYDAVDCSTVEGYSALDISGCVPA